ncbi:hypothetical protein QN277_022040 [Acacia crassicarpa]|uniref:PGG domain-containing protein n=1 Tax=Acacia crassicarpa TaxID=499986 RepID=A0AAE1JHK0_9FABA|nr:hypothetical protein QN277_022040 [Acacia crassicarpa]
MQNPREQEKMIRVLYEASRDGCVPTLRTLIQQDPLVLHRINSRTSFTDTPLHISASLGHLEFTKALLAHKPKLALELDSFGSTALHIASAEGHTHIVKELLAAYEQACFVSDQQGRIPLHVAVIRGRLEVVTELVRAKPGSSKKLHKGKTVLHLCVTYNHLDILKALVDSSLEICDELLNWRDLDGNTVLHLAIMFKQVETVRYVVSIPKIIQEASMLKNKMGFTASDIVDGIPKDLNSLEIQIILMSNGNKKDTDIIIAQEAITRDAVEEAVQAWKNNYYWRKMTRHMGKWFDHSVKWFEEMRGNLSTVATVISTMTFQSIIDPPGSFIQQGIKSNSNNTTSSPLDCMDEKDDYACPGHSNKVVMWTLSMGMCVTLTALAHAYFAALFMITPDKLWDSTSADEMLQLVDWTWLALLALAAGYILLAFLIWIVKHCIKFIKHMGKAIHTHRHRPLRRLP